MRGGGAWTLTQFLGEVRGLTLVITLAIFELTG